MSWGLQGGVWLEGPSAPLPSHPFPCRDGLCQRPAERIVQNCRQSVMQESGELRGSVWVGGAGRAGVLRPGCKSQYLQDELEERGFRLYKGG